LFGSVINKPNRQLYKQTNRSKNVGTLVEKKQLLTPVEAYTLIGMIYIIRKKGKPYVTVNELSKVINRSESRVRVILNELKKKGYVVDEDLRNMVLRERILEPLSGEHLLGGGGVMEVVDEDLDKRFRTPRGGVEKAWMINGYDILNPNGLESFFKDHAEELKYLLKIDIEELKKRLLSIGSSQT